MPNIQYTRWLVKRCRETYQKYGLLSVWKKGLSYLISEIYRLSSRLPMLDDYVLEKSVSRLQNRMEEENNLDDILDTAYGFRGVGNYRTIKPNQRRRTFKSTIESIDEIMGGVDSVLEIGTQYGGSLYIWSRHFNADVVSVDINFMNREPLLSTFSDGIVFVEGNSHEKEVCQQVRSEAPRDGYDMIFIDGDHSYKGAKEDFEMYYSLLAEDGIVLFDDIHTDYGVNDLWTELVDEYPHDEIPAFDPLFGIVQPSLEN